MAHIDLIADLAKAIHQQIIDGELIGKSSDENSWKALVPAANAVIAVLNSKNALVPGTFLEALLSQCDHDAPLPSEDSTVSTWLDSVEVGRERLEDPTVDEADNIDTKLAEMRSMLVARVLGRDEEKHKIVFDYSSTCETLLQAQKARVLTELRSDTVPFLKEALRLFVEGTVEHAELAHTTMLMEEMANRLDQEITSTVDVLVEERGRYAASVLGEDYRALFQKTVCSSSRS